MALDDVLGIKSKGSYDRHYDGCCPVSGRPPTQCLSTTIFLFQERLCPEPTIALVSPMIS
jgi:hypothetical protein